jgi:hypothetical protein
VSVGMIPGTFGWVECGRFWTAPEPPQSPLLASDPSSILRQTHFFADVLEVKPDVDSNNEVRRLASGGDWDGYERCRAYFG